MNELSKHALRTLSKQHLTAHKIITYAIACFDFIAQSCICSLLNQLQNFLNFETLKVRGRSRSCDRLHVRSRQVCVLLCIYSQNMLRGYLELLIFGYLLESQCMKAN